MTEQELLLQYLSPDIVKYCVEPYLVGNFAFANVLKCIPIVKCIRYRDCNEFYRSENSYQYGYVVEDVLRSENSHKWFHHIWFKCTWLIYNGKIWGFNTPSQLRLKYNNINYKYNNINY